MKIIKSQTVSFFAILFLQYSHCSEAIISAISIRSVISFCLNSMSSQDNSKFLVWIEFKDKGSNVNYLLSHPELYLSGRQSSGGKSQTDECTD
ncbi:MAG: hypothetical protein R2942_14455 [Ignavibacteria bacterium]